MKNAGNFFNSFVRDTELCSMGMLDLDGRFVRCNRGLERLLGKSEPELQGTAVSAALIPVGDDIPAGPGLPEWLRRQEHHTFACEGKGAKGDAFSARVFLSALRDTEGVQVGYGIIVDNLSPKLRLESEVRKSQELFEKAFSAVPDALVISRMDDGMVLEANGGWEAIFGYTRTEIVGKNSRVMGLLEPADREAAVALLQAQGRLREYEMRVRTKSGVEKHTQMSAEKILIDGKECILTILRDITEKKATEQELRNRQRLYRTLAANYPHSIVILFGPDLKVLVAEGTGLALLGLAPEKVEAGNMRDLSSPERFQRLEPFYRSALAGAASFHETEFRDRHWAVDNVPVKDEAGEVWAGLMVARDVTEFKRTISSLEKSERGNRTLLEAIPDSIYQFDAAGICVEFKAAPGAGAGGGLPAKAVGLSLAELFPKENGEPLAMSHERARRTGQTQLCEFPLGSRDATREMEARFVPLDQGNVLLLLRDITGSRNLERLAANIAAWEQRRLGGELHDGICQELAGISFLCKSLEAKLAAQAPDLGRPMAEISGLLGDAIGHTRALISGLYPAGLEHGLAEALRDLIGKLGRVYPSVFSFIGENQELSQDVAAHLYLIAQEAAGNAARHGRPASVRINLGRQDEDMILKVSDDGKGLPEGRSGAEGRGMDIMRYRARLIGARIDVRSRPGKGVTVTCTLPVNLAFGFKAG